MAKYWRTGIDVGMLLLYGFIIYYDGHAWNKKKIIEMLLI